MKRPSVTQYLHNMKLNKLNTKHLAFIEEYMINGFNATGAYMKVYPKSSYASAKAHAARLVSNGNIKVEIEARIEEYKAKYNIDREYIINEWLLQIANCKENNDRRSLNSALVGLMKVTGNDIQKTELTVIGPIKLNFGNGFIPGMAEEETNGE